MLVARRVVRECVNQKEGEKVLIVSDETHRPLAEALREAAEERGRGEIYWLGERPCREMPRDLIDRVSDAEIVLTPMEDYEEEFPLRSGLIRRATEKGRIGHMLGITPEAYPSLDVDYEVMAARTDRVAQILARGKRAEIRTPSGTHLTCDLGGWDRLPASSTGLLHEKGAFGNLPAGEAAISPLEGTAEGVIVFDRSISNIGVLEEEVTVEVSGGSVQKVKGGKEGERLQRILQRVSNGGNIAELGIGTNAGAALVGNPLVEEKVLGTIHIGLGDNTHLGGSVPAGIHIDGVLLHPTVTIDGKVLLEEGNLECKGEGEDFRAVPPLGAPALRKTGICRRGGGLKKIWQCHAGRWQETPLGNRETALLAEEIWGAFDGIGSLGEISQKTGLSEKEVRQMARLFVEYRIAEGVRR
jgi:leucyl aminopeptidase (aminopeptidase T)